MNKDKKIEEILQRHLIIPWGKGMVADNGLIEELIQLLQESNEEAVREFVEWNVKDVVGNDPKAIKDSLKRVEQFMKEREWVWCTECGKEKVYDGTMCSGCWEWLIK